MVVRHYMATERQSTFAVVASAQGEILACNSRKSLLIEDVHPVCPLPHSLCSTDLPHLLWTKTDFIDGQSGSRRRPMRLTRPSLKHRIDYAEPDAPTELGRVGNRPTGDE